MSIRPLLATLLAMSLLAVSGTLRADAWARGQGKAYVYFGASAMDATTVFDESGRRVPFPGRGARVRRVSSYLELGLSPALTVVASVPFQRLTSRGLFNDFTTSGLADLDLRLRRSAMTRAGVFAIEAGAFIPLGYRRGDFPELGSGRVDPIVNFAYGTSIRAWPGGFLSAQAGYRRRGGELADELPYSLKIGAFPHPRVGTFLFGDGRKSRGDFRGTDPTFGLTSADSESLSLGGEVYGHVTKIFDVNARWATAVRGRNAARGNEFAIGLALHSR